MTTADTLPIGTTGTTTTTVHDRNGEHDVVETVTVIDWPEEMAPGIVRVEYTGADPSDPNYLGARGFARVSEITVQD